MSAHNEIYELDRAPHTITDPGASGAIPSDQSGVVNIVTATAETRTLAAPVRPGIRLCINFLTDGGDCTITVASAYNAAGATTITLADAGDMILLQSRAYGTAFRWVQLATDGLGGDSLIDAGGFTTATTVEAAIAELYQHLFSTQAFIPIPLTSLRETSTMNVGNAAANGGVLASDTTPILSAVNGATDGCQRLQWASSNNDQVMFQIPLPPDLDADADVVLHARIASGGTTNAVGFTLASYFNEGDTAVADTTGTNQTATYTEVTATIAAADVPTGAQTLTVGLTPVAHTTDTLNLTALWIEYKRKLLTS